MVDVLEKTKRRHLRVRKNQTWRRMLSKSIVYPPQDGAGSKVGAKAGAKGAESKIVRKAGAKPSLPSSSASGQAAKRENVTDRKSGGA